MRLIVKRALPYVESKHAPQTLICSRLRQGRSGSASRWTRHRYQVPRDSQARTDQAHRAVLVATPLWRLRHSCHAGAEAQAWPHTEHSSKPCRRYV